MTVTPVDVSEVQDKGDADNGDAGDGGAGDGGVGGVDAGGSGGAGGGGPSEGAASSGPPEDVGGRQRWIFVGVVGLAVLVVAVLVVVFWPRHHHSRIPAHTTLIPISNKAITSVGGQQLLARLQTGAATTYHATYQATGKVTGGTLSFEVWQSPPNLREDTVFVHDGHTERTESFETATTGRLCAQEDTGPWSCRAVPVADSAGAGVAGIQASIANTVSGHGVIVTSATFAGRAVQCYQVDSGSQPKLCVTSTGIPVLMSDTSVSYQLASLSSSVDKTVFNPPA